MLSPRSGQPIGEYKYLDETAYPRLSNFLWGCVHDEHDLLDDSIPRIVAEFRGSSDSFDDVLPDIDRVLRADPFPFEELVHTANWSFDSPESARAFLEELRDEITRSRPKDESEQKA